MLSAFVVANAEPSATALEPQDLERVEGGPDVPRLGAMRDDGLEDGRRGQHGRKGLVLVERQARRHELGGAPTCRGRRCAGSIRP